MDEDQFNREQAPGQHTDNSKLTAGLPSASTAGALPDADDKAPQHMSDLRYSSEMANPANMRNQMNMGNPDFNAMAGAGHFGIPGHNISGPGALPLAGTPTEQLASLMALIQGGKDQGGDMQSMLMGGMGGLGGAGGRAPDPNSYIKSLGGSLSGLDPKALDGAGLLEAANAMRAASERNMLYGLTQQANHNLGAQHAPGSRTSDPHSLSALLASVSQPGSTMPSVRMQELTQGLNLSPDLMDSLQKLDRASFHPGTEPWGMPQMDYDRMQAAMRNPHLPPPAHQPHMSGGHGSRPNPYEAQLPHPHHAPPRAHASSAKALAAAAAAAAEDGSEIPKERTRGGQCSSVLVAKVLTISDASHGRVILPRVAVEANLSFVRQYRTFALQVKDHMGLTWEFNLKSWANGAESRRVYVLEKMAPYLKRYDLGVKDAIGICASDKGELVVEFNTPAVEEATVRPTYGAFPLSNIPVPGPGKSTLLRPVDPSAPVQSCERNMECTKPNGHTGFCSGRRDTKSSHHNERKPKAEPMPPVAVHAMPVPSLLPQPASLIPLPENTLPPETFDDHCRTLEVMAEALELPDPNAPNSEAKLLDAAYFFDGPVFAKRLTRADVRTARVVMPAAIEPILPWLARDLLAPEIQFHVTTGSDATAEADEGSVHLLCMHCTSAVVPGTKQHLVVLFGMRSVIEALRLVEGDVIGVRKAGDQLIFEINSDEIRQFEADWMSMDAEAHQSRLAHCAGHGPGDGSSYASGSVLVCTRTSGCTKQAGHQGFCSGHKGFNKRKGEDGYFEKELAAAKKKAKGPMKIGEYNAIDLHRYVSQHDAPHHGSISSDGAQPMSQLMAQMGAAAGLPHYNMPPAPQGGHHHGGGDGHEGGGSAFQALMADATQAGALGAGLGMPVGSGQAYGGMPSAHSGEGGPIGREKEDSMLAADVLMSLYEGEGARGQQQQQQQQHPGQPAALTQQDQMAMGIMPDEHQAVLQAAAQSARQIRSGQDQSHTHALTPHHSVAAPSPGPRHAALSDMYAAQQLGGPAAPQPADIAAALMAQQAEGDMSAAAFNAAGAAAAAEQVGAPAEIVAAGAVGGGDGAGNVAAPAEGLSALLADEGKGGGAPAVAEQPAGGGQPPPAAWNQAQDGSYYL